MRVRSRVSLNVSAVQTDRIAQACRAMACLVTFFFFVASATIPPPVLQYAEAQTNHNSLCANKYGFRYTFYERNEKRNKCVVTKHILTMISIVVHSFGFVSDELKIIAVYQHKHIHLLKL